jgi:hypothetical protein
VSWKGWLWPDPILHSGISWWDWGKPRSGSVWTTGFRVKNWARNLPNTSEDGNHSTVRFSVKLWTWWNCSRNFVNVTRNFRVPEKAGSFSSSWSRRKPYCGVGLHIDLSFTLRSFRSEVPAASFRQSHLPWGSNIYCSLGFEPVVQCHESGFSETHKAIKSVGDAELEGTAASAKAGRWWGY